MTRMISDRLLFQFSGFICDKFGLHYPEKRRRDLERNALSLAYDFNFPDAESCVRWIVTASLSDSELDTIACRLTIGETYFFRERKSFDALEAHILRALIDSRRGKEQRLRIWSAGCATGEEAYSIAILLQRMLPDLPKWNITILATDINPVFIRKASGGEYGEWSFRGVPHWLKEKYFTLNGKGRYKLADGIRKMVTFARLNLADDPYPSLLNNTNAMDVIFCRNVLMYFSPDRIKKTVSGFRHSLLDGGWLVVSPCEVSHALFPGFEAVSLNDAVFYRKERRDQPAGGFSGKVDSGGAFAACTGKSPLAPLCQRGGDIDEKNGAADSDLIMKSPPAAPFPAATSGREDSGTHVSPREDALVLYRQGEYGAAAAILVEFLANSPPGSIPPPHGEAAVLLARALANQGKFAEALEWLEKAIAFDRLNPKPYYLQATIFQEQGFDDAAVISLKKAIYVDHEFVLAHFALASLNLRRGKREEAVRHLENAASLLNEHADDDILPGADGLSARRLAEIIAETRKSIVEKKQAASS